MKYPMKKSRLFLDYSNKELKRIRARASYRAWARHIEKLDVPKSRVRRMARIVHDILDEYSGYGSERLSFYSEESMLLYLEDKGYPMLALEKISEHLCNQCRRGSYCYWRPKDSIKLECPSQDFGRGGSGGII